MKYNRYITEIDVKKSITYLNIKFILEKLICYYKCKFYFINFIIQQNYNECKLLNSCEKQKKQKLSDIDFEEIKNGLCVKELREDVIVNFESLLQDFTKYKKIIILQFNH